MTRMLISGTLLFYASFLLVAFLYEFPENLALGFFDRMKLPVVVFDPFSLIGVVSIYPKSEGTLYEPGPGVDGLEGTQVKVFLGPLAKCDALEDCIVDKK